MNTDPVYLREVLVGLEKGTVTSDVSSLPFGVDSVFERWTSEWSGDAGHSIDILRLYAVLKSPLSPQGVSFLLNIATEHVTAAIQDNAHLFNQTTGVGHGLFHDRFRIFILAASSHHELKTIQNQLHTKLEDVLQTPEAHTKEIKEYSFRHFAEHGICSDASPNDLLTTVLDASVVKSHERCRLSDGWVRIRNHFHQLRIRERYAEPKAVINLCLRELELSQRYTGQDVVLSNGIHSLELDNQHDYPSLAALALVELKQGHRNKGRRRFEQCRFQFRAQWGKTATLTDCGGDQIPYEYTRTLLEHVVANAASQNASEFVFDVLRFIDEFSWGPACRAAMRGACTAGHHDLGLELLKWLSQYAWYPEEEHPLEIAGQMGAEPVVMAADNLYEDRWFLESALQKLSIYHLSNNQPKLANPAFQKLVASIKSPTGYRAADQPLRLILLASVLGHTRGFTAALENTLEKIQALYESSDGSTQENLAQNIRTELGQIPRTSQWTSQLFDITGTPSFTYETNSNSHHTEKMLTRCFPNLLSTRANSNCPPDWPQRMLCREKPASSTAMRIGLALEWQFRGGKEIEEGLGLPLA